MKFPVDTELFAGWEEHLELAKEYIKKHGLTDDDVKIVRRGEQLIVRAKREVYLGH